MRDSKLSPTASRVPAIVQPADQGWINHRPAFQPAKTLPGKIFFQVNQHLCLWLLLVTSTWLAGAVSVHSQEEIELNNRTTTFTNLHGKVYENVQLERATHDGLIYTSTNTGSIGMVRYSDLSTNFLSDLEIPDSLVAKAAERQKALALEKQRYDEANRLLEWQQETNAAARYAAAQAQVAAASQNNTPQPQAKNKPVRTEVKHHRRRR